MHLRKSIMKGTVDLSHPGKVTNMPSAKQSLAIIGAGIAGLTAARKLHDSGFSVTLFDKGRSPGGRISSRHINTNLQFDHGAQYITVSDERFARQVDGWVEQGWVAEWKGLVVQIQAGEITEKIPQKRFVGVPTMSSIAKGLSRDLTILSKTTISTITHASSGWFLQGDDCEYLGPFDSLMLAIPAPQAAALLDDHPLAQEFYLVFMEPCWAVLVAFEDRVPAHFDGAFVEDSPLAWIARNSSKPHRTKETDHWVLHATPEWSSKNIEANPDQVITDLLTAFAESIALKLPKTKLTIAHRWRYARSAPPSNQMGYLHHPESRLTLIGDWLYDGRIEGAFLSGWEAADRLLADNDPA